MTQELEAYLASLPVDDEPLTAEEVARIEQGKRDIAAGRVLTSEQLRVELAAERDE